ncbi:aspartic proteinase-like protein [Klebsormidium nitens]|uniref:Aspartic proteinase-like protein n=1 Tax=Klebsormidium nitens TaxID=105231 RepID=A0A1Y1IDI2_KLENI|nr:aspartic proteinase-like protein [Klebsormidium nitens]|eukprot:GAQ89014.1 aspartic proteinase-like protein [Klebsormidium nitens]
MAPENGPLPLSSLLLLLALFFGQLSFLSAQITIPVARQPFPPHHSASQSAAKAAYFSSFVEGGSASTAVPLSGGNLPLGLFLVNVSLGTPPVDVPVIIDTGSSLCFVQGPDCTSCPGPSVCQNSPFSGGSSCPYAGPTYDPLVSSTAVTDPPCGRCAAPGGIGDTGCLGRGYSENGTCQFEIGFGSGNAAGKYVQDTVSVGGVSSGEARIFLGTTTFQAGFEQGAAGLFGFGPTATSLPFQLKEAGALPSSTFALCLASGHSTGGTLFLGGVPTQPDGSPYAVTYTGPLLQNPSVEFAIPSATDVLVNGVPVPGAAAKMERDAERGSKWIVDSGTTLTFLETPIYNSLFGAIQLATGCLHSVSLGGLDYVDLTTCNPPFLTFSDGEISARFPTLTLQLQGTQAIARPASYTSRSQNAMGPFVHPGIANGGEGNGTWVIGDSFLTDNLVR